MAEVWPERLLHPAPQGAGNTAYISFALACCHISFALTSSRTAAPAPARCM